MTPALNRPVRILFVLPTLSFGGAERAAVNLLRHLDRTQFEPRLALVRGDGPLARFLPGEIPVTNLRRRRMRHAIPALRRLLIEQRPDVVFSILEHTTLAVLLAARLSRRFRTHPPKIIANVQNALSRQLPETPWPARSLLRWGIKNLYPQAAGIVVLSRGAADDFVQLFPHLRERVHVIANAVIDGMHTELAEEAVPHPWFAAAEPVILACGRLARQKGFDILLHALAFVRRRHVARLVILGEGPERGRLENLAATLGLRDFVDLPGADPNPFRYMARAAVFVLSSRWEGLANVLIEAMACGAPCVAADCVAGPSEIIRHGVDGLLVPPEKPEALAHAILTLLQNRDLARRYGEAARKSALRFEAGAITRQYESFFARLNGEGGRC